MRMIVTAVGMVLVLGGCVGRASDEPSAIEGQTNLRDRAARASLVDASGRNLASAELASVGGGVRVRLTATGMAPGAYGAHVHMAGRCDAPDFTTAGAHWNPTGVQHGRENPAGAHRGDLPNLAVGTNGRGAMEHVIAGATLRGPSGMLDADGSALLIHANADNYRTDPSGNSGARIACGVIG